MAFDVEGAIRAGYNETEIATFLSEENNFDLSGAMASGYSPGEVIQFLSDMDSDDTTFLGSVGEFGKRALGGVATGVVSTATGLGQLIPGVDDEAMLSADQSFREGVAETLGYDSAYDENYGAQLGQVVGEMVPMVASAFLPGGALGIAARVGAVTGPALSEGGFDRAEFEARTGEKLSDYERLASKGADVALGQLERFGIPARILKGLPKGFLGSKNPITNRITSMLAGGLREGTQEVGQGIARDISTLAIYDPDRKIADSAIDDFTLGGGAGAIYDLAIGLAQSPLRGRKNRAPKPLGEMTEEEVAQEQELAAQAAARREQSRAEGDERTRLLDEARRAAEAGAPDAFDTTQLSPDLSADQLAQQVILRTEALEDYAPFLEEGADADIPIGMPARDAFSVKTEDNMFYVEQNGRQFGPKMQDRLKATDLMIRLNQYSANLRKQADTEYAVDQIQYPEVVGEEPVGVGEAFSGPLDTDRVKLEGKKTKEAREKEEEVRAKLEQEQFDRLSSGDRSALQQTITQPLREEMIEFGNAIPSPDERVITVEQAEASSPGISTKVNKSRVKQGKSPITSDGPITAFTLNEVRKAGGDIGAIADALAVQDADALAFERGQQPDPVAQTGIDPTRPGQPALGRQRQLQQFKSSFDNELSAERAFTALLDSKMIDGGTDSQAFRGLVKRIIGKAPAKTDPLSSLSPSERRYLYQKIRQLPSFRGQQTPVTLPDFSVKVPPAEMVQKAQQAVRAGESPERAIEREQFRQSGETLSQAETGRVTRQAERTAQPVERGGEPIPEGQQVVPYDIDQSALGQQLRDMLKQYGLDDVWATRMVESVGNALRDSQGNIYIDGRPADGPEGTVVEGQADPTAQVIQVALDGVMRDVNDNGVPYDVAVAKIMNHEIVHALKAMDLFTAAEWSLLERLSRTYRKQPEGVTYGQWAAVFYKDLNAVKQQEEAIAELISDALTGKTMIGSKITKPSGKPATIMQKIVNFFKRLVGFAEQNDVQSFDDLINKLQSGEIGGRERGVVRTPLRTEKRGGTDRFTDESLRGEIGERGIPALDDIERRVKGKKPDKGQTVGDAPTVMSDSELSQDQAMESRRARAEEQGFDTSTVYYTGSRIMDYSARADRAGKRPEDITLEPRELPIKRFDPTIRNEAGLNMPLAFGLVAGHFTTDPKFTNQFSGVSLYKKDLQDMPEKPVVYPVYLRHKKDNNLGGLFAYYEAEAEYALEPVANAVETPLNQQPNLREDLVNYYSLELGEIDRLYDIINPDNAPISDTRALINTVNSARYGSVEKSILRQLGGPLRLNLFKGKRGVEQAAFYMWEKSNAEQFKTTPEQIKRKYALDIAEEYHRNQAPVFLESLVEEPESVTYHELERLAPYIKEAGFVGYHDIEYSLIDKQDGDTFDSSMGVYTGVAMFNPEDIKGVYAAFDPDAVPEGESYGDDIMYSRRLSGMPEAFDVDGQSVEFGYHKPAVDAAVRYTQSVGLPYEPLTEYAPVNRDMATRIAIEFDLMEHKPNDPDVRASYDALIEETEAQYEAILDTGLVVQFIKGEDPYGNPRNAILDVINNNHMYVFSTRDGYGSEESLTADLAENPMLKPTKYKTSDGDPMLANDVFRVVHDYFGHIKNGVGFRARGEENAWQSHAAMYSPLARRAMTSETRGQNSWVNYGPYAEANKTASGADTVYADQKIGLMPLWVSEEERLSDPRRRDIEVFQRGLEGAIRPDGKLQLTHFGHKRFARTNPEMAGRGLDRSRRFAPKGTYFGITKATENGYRKEKGLGPVEHTFTVDPVLLYPINQDPNNLIARHPAGNLDWDGTLKNLNDNGFIGFWANDKRIGKTAFINQPLIAESDKDNSSYSRLTQSLAKRSVASQQQIDQAVQNNLDQISTTQGPPRFSVKASPEAQYIGQNPDAAIDPVGDDIMESRAGLSSQQSATIDKLTTNTAPENPNGRVFMDVTGSSPLGEMLTRFKQMAINRFAGLEKYYQRVPGLKELEADSSAIAAALFSDRAKGIVASAVKYGVPVYENGLTKVVEFEHNGRSYRGLIEVMSLIYNKEVGDLRKLAQSYAMVKRSEKLRQQGKKTPVTQEDAAQIEAAVRAYDRADGTNPITEWHGVWTAYNNKTIQFLKNTGILNEETAAQWEESAYVPFYRGAEEGGEGLPKVVSGVFGDLTRKSDFKKYVGSEKGVDIGLIESVTLNLSAAVEMGMRNVAQQRIARDMQSMGLARQIPVKAKGKNAITFKVDGRPVRFEIFDNLIYDSMETMTGGVTTEILQKYLGKPSAFLREMITRDPGFMIANMLRDTLSTSVTSGSNFIPLYDTFRNFGLGGQVESLEKLGVVGGYDFNIDEKDILDFYSKETKRRGIGPDGGRGSPLSMFTTVWDTLGRATTASDAATRSAVYKDVLARTGNEAEAAFQAMEIINFSRRGSHPLARVLTAAIPFLNARFQGLDVFVRAAYGDYSTNKQDTRGITAAKVLSRGALLAGLTAIYWALVSDDEQYKEQSEEVRDNNWLIPTRWGVPVRIPIPFEVGLLFKTIPETMIAAAYGDKTAPEVYGTVKRGVVSTLEINPLFGAQAYAPLAEAALNHNFFTDRPIVPYYIDTKIEAGLQDATGTTEMAKFIGQALNISPFKVDHVMAGYTGTLGGYLIGLADVALKSSAVKGEDAVLPPSKNIFEFPLWRRFFGAKEGSGLKQDAYELYNEVSTAVNTLNKLKRENRVDEYNAYLSSRMHILQLKDPVYSVKRYLDGARDYKRKVISSDLEPDIKRQMIDDLDAQINEYLTVLPALREAADLPAIKTFSSMNLLAQ